MYLNNLIWNYVQYQIHVLCMLYIGASSGIEECEEIRVDSVQMDMQHLNTNSEEGK